MTPQEALQMLVDGGNQGAAFEPSSTFQVGPNYMDAFNATNATPPVAQGGAYSLDSAQPVSADVLAMLQSGVQKIVENRDGSVAADNYNPEMDGPIQEARTLTGLKYSDKIARVNAHTAQDGIIARPDADGRVVLTNLTPEGTRIQTKQAGYDIDGRTIGAVESNPSGMKTANSIQGILSLMRSTNDAATARGLKSQLDEAMAAEQAKLYTQAQEQAGNKLGIPDLEKQLASMQALERTLPGYRPNMPESPQTQAVRSHLEQTRSLVDAEAKRYLTGNVTYHSLEAAAKNADGEVLRITKLEDGAARRKETNDYRTNARLDQQSFVESQREEQRKFKEEQAAEKQAIEASALTQQQRDAVKVLYPEKANADDIEIVKTIKLQGQDKEFQAIINAEEGKLPMLSATGNTKATKLLIAKEEAAGVDPALTQVRLRELSKLFSNDKLVEEQMLKEAGTGKEAKAAVMQTLLKGKTSLGTAEEKKAYMETKYQAAVSKLKQGVETTYRNRLEQWNIPDPEFQAALATAKTVTGTTNMKEVLGAYMGNTSGPERRAKVDQFKQFAKQAAQGTKTSQLGSIDPVMLSNDIETLGIRSMGQRLMEYLQTKVEAPIYKSALYNPLGAIDLLNQVGTQHINSFLNKKE